MVFVYGVVIFVNLQLLCLLCLIGQLCQCCYFGGGYTKCVLRVVHVGF